MQVDIDRVVQGAFYAGAGVAVSGAAAPIVAAGHAPQTLRKGVRIKAALANGPDVYIAIGPSTVQASSGFRLEAGSDVLVEIDDPSKVYVIGGGTGADEVQTLTMTAVAGDVYRVTFGGETTDDILVGSDAASVQTILEGLSGIGAGNVVVGGTSLLDGPLTLTFQGDLAGINVAAATVVGGTNAKQTIAIDDLSGGGTFTLTFGEETTAGIAYDADAAAVRSALETLANVGVGNVKVTGGPGPSADWVVEWANDLGHSVQSLLAGDGSLLTGGSTDVTVTETVAGASKTVTVAETTPGGVFADYSWIAA